jgi:hypothetical protein
MAKKGLDEDRLKFFKGMGEAKTSESEKTESDGMKSAISESDKRESELSESDKSESDKRESVISESDSDKPKSDKIGLRLSESDKSESDNRKLTNKRRSHSSKIPIPRSRGPSTIPKIRARKVDDSVLDQAISAASSPQKFQYILPL